MLFCATLTLCAGVQDVGAPCERETRAPARSRRGRRLSAFLAWLASAGHRIDRSTAESELARRVARATDSVPCSLRMGMSVWEQNCCSAEKFLDRQPGAGGTGPPIA